MMKDTVQMNLPSHTSVLNKLEVPNVNLENSALTSLFSFKFESQSPSKTIDIYAVSHDSRSKQMHSDAHNQFLFNKTVYRRFWPEGPKGTKIGLRSNVIRSILYVSAKWSFLCADVAATKTRSRRVYPFGIRSPPVISSRSSAGGTSREYKDSRCLDKRWRRNATGDVLKCWTGWTETYKKSSPRALIERKYGSPRTPDTSAPSSMRSRNVSWSKSRTLSFSTSGINITVPAWICGSSSSLYPKSWSSVRSLSCILLAMNESVKTLLDPGISKVRNCEPQEWKTKVKSQSHQDSYQLSFNPSNPNVKCQRLSCRNRRKFRVHLSFQTKRTAKATRCWNLTLGKRNTIPTSEQTSKVWYLLKYCLSFHLQDEVGLEITGNVAGATKDGTYPWGLGVEGVAGVPIAPNPIVVGGPGGNPHLGIPGLIDPVPTGTLLIKSVCFIVARSRMNCSLCSPVSCICWPV